MTRHWAAPYVGIPYLKGGSTTDGVYCWGLVVLVYRVELGIDLPAYGATVDAAERAEIARLTDQAAASPVWTKVEGAPQPFDVLAFERAGVVNHFGVFLRDDLFLHVEEDGDEVHPERLQGSRWGARLAGVYRYVGPGRGA